MTDNGLSRETVTSLLAVVAVVCAFSISIGYVFPALALRIHFLGGSTTLTGLQSATAGIGVILGGFLVPFLVMRINGWQVTLAGLFITAVMIFIFGLVHEPWLYVGLRLITGLSASILFVISETWVNQFAPDAYRGRIVAIYTSVMAATFGIGPLLIPIIGYKTLFPWALMAAVMLVMAAPLWLIYGKTPTINPVSNRQIGKALGRIPVLLLAVACFGFVDGAFLGLWPAYGLARELSEDRISYLLVAFILGNIFLQVPIGFLADKLSNRMVMRIAAALTLCMAGLVPLLNLEALYIWPYVIVMGAVSFSVYTLSMAMIGKHLKGAELVAANAAFSIVWGFGTLLGAGATGVLMDEISIHALPISVAVIYGCLFLALVFFEPVRKKSND